ncbi:hypothetical protein HYPSUDRAFT_210161 [Hypholoma sublateritium FD-334 SS-4]|uniref:Uncharacterized protein n=1 Tax=Hypholoma sublateritium (strain FD-334 SS-4) TaxID=945553 RepID=A0A0D2NW27_HYPSF|nr:hypothetical protein HYPSUDRAFT_210161 [Hypholoma sublateritium FD-334 SS-4]
MSTSPVLPIVGVVPPPISAAACSSAYFINSVSSSTTVISSVTSAYPTISFSGVSSSTAVCSYIAPAYHLYHAKPTKSRRKGELGVFQFNYLNSANSPEHKKRKFDGAS